MAPQERADLQRYPAEKARQGEVILKTPLQRGIFIAVVMAGKTMTFDSFECAIASLAPTCTHCDCRVIGHGVEALGGAIFCCVHCASHSNVKGLKDRV